MFTSFSTALSALDATSTAIDVVANNLANLNTTSYKDSTVSFQALVTQSLGAGLAQTQVGFGVGRPITTTQFTQGALETASGTLDSAIQGQGFFVIDNPTTGQQLYTRDGTFQIDSEGNLQTANGEHVQGYMVNNGVASQSISNIIVPVGQIRQPIATQNISVSMNLDATSANGTPNTFSTPIQVIDSLGNPLTLTMNFTQDATNPLQWNYQVSVPGNATTGGTPGVPTPLLATPGTLTFDSSGKLVSPPPSSGTVALQVTGLSDNAADLNINWNFYSKTGNATITQFSQASAVSANSQDGQNSAQLVSVAMATGGQVMAQYSDGTQEVVAQVALANISNPQSMIASGNNDYEASASTALPAVGIANTGGRGQIQGGALESSTVDIALEFTNLITLQRAYQANSKVVTTVDQLSQDTINLKAQ